MHLLLIEMESGIALAAVYALLAVSLTFTYAVTGVVQLAQGSIMICGAFAGYFLAEETANPIAVAIAGGCCAAILGLLAYLGIFRWLVMGGHLPPLVAGLALAGAIEETLRLSFFDGQPVPYPKLDWVGTAASTRVDALVISLAIAVGIAFEVMMRLTQFGRSLRATADNEEVAQLLGIRAEWMRTAAFVLGAGLAGIAGVLLAAVNGSIAFGSGGFLEFVAVACILLGGLGSISGALLGAVVLGLGQVLISAYVSATYVNALVFGIVLAVIVVRPSGLLGTEPGARA
jgi:branched-chain amino acid transport system permease protein